MADTAYDADHLRKAIAAKGALAVIPNNPSRALKYPLDKHLYAQRHLVECCFSKLKQFRRVATRFEKTARNYRAVVTLAAIVLDALVSTPPKGLSPYATRYDTLAREIPTSSAKKPCALALDHSAPKILPLKLLRSSGSKST